MAMKLSPQAPEAEGAQEILQKLGQRPRPTASLPKKQMEPPDRPPRHRSLPRSRKRGRNREKSRHRRRFSRRPFPPPPPLCSTIRN
ncbi:MAG: hypothetical protein MPW14_22525 [Candidatus Manganitrophus sp.]|nr:MAG: hypothetical protein MPW14_22525 [Candidatus Manganitrophus sp.]